MWFSRAKFEAQARAEELAVSRRQLPSKHGGVFVVPLQLQGCFLPQIGDLSDFVWQGHQTPGFSVS